ncbi:high-affinity choline transporter 1-like, partial [Hyalella azteca]|uniref:High-affinity choline transporter 1-like n=1 Tax=Hyalella azteca TaxID=294128 RepID=A0A8B7NSN0_HYAAZ
STLSVILDLPDAISIVVSASIAVLYTLVGGLYSVAYTDVVQLFCIAIGLWLAVPFSLHSEYSGSLNPNTTNWLGEPPNNPYEWGTWWDYAFLLICGGIPWQVYFQRVLSAKTGRQAQILSYGAAIGCFVMAIPAVLIGAIAKTWVAFIGLGAVSAAVMSSADSSVLSASSMFTHNVYKGVIRPHASIREMNIVLRLAIPVITAVACAIAIFTTSIYALFYLCGDLVYVMLFPQLTLAVHCPNHVNRPGSIVAFVVGFLLRILGGEPVLQLPAVIKYPWYDYENETQNFPFRTLSMLVTMIALLLVSRFTRTCHGRQQNLTITTARTQYISCQDLRQLRPTGKNSGWKTVEF